MKFLFRSVLFLGIGGVSMHQLALAFKDLGLNVCGYDAVDNDYVKMCKEHGVTTTNKFLTSFTKVDLCVRTGAIGDDNIYIKELNKRHVKIIDRIEALNWLSKKFKTVIAVAGTHGKSTTSSLIYHILNTDNRKVSCHIGADIDNAKFKIGDDFLVIEACEYKKSFLSLFPDISVVTNVEADHMDCYKNMFELKNSFLLFLKRATKRYVYLDNSTKYLTRQKNINFVTTSSQYTTLLKGEHNMKNIALASRVCLDLGVSQSVIDKAISTFNGVKRRYECIGDYNEQKIYIDYAHHPTEIEAFVSTFLKEHENGQIIFQPHTYSRTKYLLKDFICVLGKIDDLIIYKEYPARECKNQGLSALDLFNLIKPMNKTVKYVDNYNQLKKNLIKNVDLAFVGAGDINKVAEKLTLTNSKKVLTN